MNLTIDFLRMLAREARLTVSVQSTSAEVTLHEDGTMSQAVHGAGSLELEPPEEVLASAERVILKTRSAVQAFVSPTVLSQCGEVLSAFHHELARRHYDGDRTRVPELLPAPDFRLSVATVQLPVEESEHVHLLGRKEATKFRVNGVETHVAFGRCTRCAVLLVGRPSA